jgi:serine/threonine protein kinase
MRSATVVAEGEVRVLRLSREVFMSFIDDNVNALLMERMRLQDDTVSLEDLQYCDTLGHGAYGNVYLTKSKKTEVSYAIKTIPRVRIEYSKIYNYVLREKSILI